MPPCPVVKLRCHVKPRFSTFIWFGDCLQTYSGRSKKFLKRSTEETSIVNIVSLFEIWQRTAYHKFPAKSVNWFW
jgi:hypothetical protein